MKNHLIAVCWAIELKIKFLKKWSEESLENGFAKFSPTFAADSFGSRLCVDNEECRFSKFKFHCDQSHFEGNNDVLDWGLHWRIRERS